MITPEIARKEPEEKVIRSKKKSKTPLQATGHQICSAAEQRGI